MNRAKYQFLGIVLILGSCLYLAITGIWSQYFPSFENVYQKASQGDAEAQFRLGTMYHWGKGTPKNPQEAHRWFLKAAKQGNAQAQETVGQSLELGWTGIKDLKQAIFWYEKAAAQGDTYAQDDLASIYLEKKDYPKAAYWLTKAAKAGNSVARSDLGYLYYYGYGVPQDYQLSFYWTKKSADAGVGIAKANLAEMYARGLWVEKDPQKALELYQDAVSHMHIRAAVNVGYIYANGIGVPKNEAKGNYWYSRFLTEATTEELYDIADSFITGQVTEIDKKEAYFWMHYAALQGGAKAVEQLQKLEKELNAPEKSEVKQRIAAMKSKTLFSESSH